MPVYPHVCSCVWRASVPQWGRLGVNSDVLDGSAILPAWLSLLLPSSSTLLLPLLIPPSTPALASLGFHR